ncbi:cytochrome P450 4V2-like isoform X2 [Argiope bruennichi]|uniref:cytochrome P450 4V2-like isoform X2 n=1 Tax=Argiope bruennichi TaxID=94029 RepID=UPI002494EBCC|nr:cytochrome P450 4V2-like isoform X2 [Argiope bruennichi]
MYGIMELLCKRAELFQKEKLFCVWAAYIPFVFFVRADAVKELLKNNKLNDKSWVYEWIQPLVGKGLITSGYDLSKSRRKALAPCFYTDVLRSFLPVFSDEAQKLVKFLQKETKNEFTYIAEPISLCASDITCETIFGITINALENENLETSTSFSRASSIFMSKVISPWQWIDIIFRNTKMGKEFHYHCNVLQEVARKITEEKKMLYRRGEEKKHTRKHKALMELLLDNKELTEQEIDEEMYTFALAGHINTTATVRWTLYLIGLYPDVQAKLHEEIDLIFGNDLEKPVTEDDLRQLQYLDCVLKESNRLYPSVSLFARQVNKDTKISGYTIPKGANCVLFTYFLHRDPEIFPDPEKFDPDRFLPENKINIPEYGFIPFSVGPRSCIGFKFAEMEVKVIIIQILRNFTIKSLDQRDKIKLILTPTLHPHIPIRIRIRHRFDRSFP